MFNDKTVLLELERLIAELHITNSKIVFRHKSYAILPNEQLTGLTNILYSECYALKEIFQTGLTKKEHISLELDTNFVAQLSKYNFTTEKIDSGWHIKSNLSNGYFEVVKGSAQKTIHFSEFRETNTTVHSKENTVSIFLSKEDKQRQPTFYYVFSHHNLDLKKDITRVYWNINSDGAAQLVKIITETLNDYNVPFLFKCLNNPNLYFRRDAAVLYIDNEHLQILNVLLPEWCAKMSNYLDEDVPLFAYKYAKGVGIAENPTKNESFGMHRMSLVAKSLLQSFAKKMNSKETLKHIATALLNKGIHPERPYLNKGSKVLF